MNDISVDRDTMSQLIKQNQDFSNDSSRGLGGFSAGFDGGLASGEISVITRVALESAQLAADIVTVLCAIATAAINGQFADDDAIREALDALLNTELGE